MHATNQGRLRRLGGRGQSRFFETCENEAVDRIPHPSLIRDFGRDWLIDRLKRPVRCGFKRATRRRAFRPWGSQTDPSLDVLNLLGRQFAPYGHLEVAVLSQRTQDQAVCRTVKRDSLTSVTPLQQGFARLDRKAARPERLVMALRARSLEYRPNRGLEELNLFWRESLTRDWGCRDAHQDPDCQR